MTNLREQVAALRGDLDALQAKVERMPGYEKSELAELEAKGKGEVAPIEVVRIEIGAENLKYVRAMTEDEAPQITDETTKVIIKGKTIT